MSQPFAQIVARRVAQRTDAELSEETFNRFEQWAHLSGDKHVSLDEVAWAAALFVKALKLKGLGVAKTETRDANGARVVGVVASDGVPISDGAG